jgi:hypothetical protein
MTKATSTLTLKACREIAGSIGYPSKMPGTSYGLPAQQCITGRKLAKFAGSVCSSCYAFERGNYQYSSVKKAQAKRLSGITHPLWEDAMVTLLTHDHERGRNPKTHQRMSKHHRWHDSGDLQSVDHLARLCAIARRLPWLKFWLPTREGMMLRSFERGGGTIPGNLVIRLSATMVDGPAPKAWPQTSTVHKIAATVGHGCPAPLQGNKCGCCRAGWDATIANVSYHLH